MQNASLTALSEASVSAAQNGSPAQSLTPTDLCKQLSHDDLRVWADKLRSKYGIAWPLATDDDDTTD